MGKKGRYFVIAALMPENPKRIRNFMRRFCVSNGLREVKASKLSVPEKQEIFNKLCGEQDYAIAYVVADKLNIKNERVFKDKNILYNYLFSFLAHSIVQGNKEDITILLDNHSTKVKSVNSLQDYIKIKAYTQWGYTRSLAIHYVDSKESKMIQAADLVANAIYAKYTYGRSNPFNMLTIRNSIVFPFKTFGLDAKNSEG